MVRLVCRRLTNQTKQACSLNPISRTLAASHKDFMLKQPSWSSFVSTHREPSPAEVCSFLSRLTKETWGTSKRQKDTGKSPGTSRGRMKYKSHGESPIPSQLCGCWPCKGRPPWWEQGSGTMDDGAPGGRTLGFSPNPALCFPSRMETPPPPRRQHRCLTPVLAVVAHRLVNTHRELPPWGNLISPLQQELDLPDEKSLQWICSLRGSATPWWDRVAPGEQILGLASSPQLVGLDHRGFPAVTEDELPTGPGPLVGQVSWTDLTHTLMVGEALD